MREELNMLTKEDFLKNDFFIESQLNPNPTTDAFWTNLMMEGKIDPKAFFEAKKALLNLDMDARIEIDDEIINRLWQRISKGHSEQSRRRFRLTPVIKVACSLILIVASAIILLINRNKSEDGIYAHIASASEINQYKDSEDILLILSEEEKITTQDGTIIDYSSEDKIKLEDKTLEKNHKEIKYNQLIVPYGKKVSLVLSDGSTLWVNAGTHVVYPDKFPSDKREIYVNGEVYADVRKDTKRPFSIKAKDIDIEVLGTKFNLNSYEGRDARQIVVLVEGSVQVKGKNNKKALLKPNQAFFQTEDSQSIKHVDVSDYISWVEGYYSFSKEKLGVILEHLSAYYGVKIICDSEAFDLRCSGGLDLKDDLKRVLDVLSNSTSATYIYDENNKVYTYSINN